MILGTTGHEQPIYGQELIAMPTPAPPWPTNVDDTNLEELYLDHPFNWAMSFALFKLGDAGVLADVHRFRSSYLKLKGLKNKNMHLEHIIGALQFEKEGHTEEITTFAKEVEGIKDRLVAARVRTRVQPILARLSVEGIIQYTMSCTLYHSHLFL